MRITPPDRLSDPSALSEGAKTILRHFRDTGAEPRGYEYPATLAELIPDWEELDRAQAELADKGLIDRAAYPAGVPREVMSCAITVKGKTFIATGGIDE